MSNHCKNCFFFQESDLNQEVRTSTGETVKIPLGHCHRRAPQVFAASIRTTPEPNLRVSKNGIGALQVGPAGTAALVGLAQPGAAWPLVKLEDWCGEFMWDETKRPASLPPPNAERPGPSA